MLVCFFGYNIISFNNRDFFVLWFLLFLTSLFFPRLENWKTFVQDLSINTYQLYDRAKERNGETEGMQKLNHQNFFKLSKKAHHVMFITIQYAIMGVTQFAFELLALNAKIKGDSNSCNVAMVSYYGI